MCDQDWYTFHIARIKTYELENAVKEIVKQFNSKIGKWNFKIQIV